MKKKKEPETKSWKKCFIEIENEIYDEIEDYISECRSNQDFFTPSDKDEIERQVRYDRKYITISDLENWLDDQIESGNIKLNFKKDTYYDSQDYLKEHLS
ncbi:MAG TPA: hypothetical protein VKN74_02630 [Candidatus Mcinerneyibacterium sp.]|nr:hypothetical protein [Candidatus Mcinerneyibacterium sp.]